MKIFLIICLMILSICCSACSKDVMQDGYYTAEMAEFSHGWKEFITITVKNNEIVTVEYNAKNSSGFIKSWDSAYMKNMNSIVGTYPNEYTRNYASQLSKKQSAENIDMISGASTSGGNFKMLSTAAINQSKKGDSSIAVIK